MMSKPINGPITRLQLYQLVIDELERLDYRFDKKGNIFPPDTTDKKIVRRLHETSCNLELQKKQSWLHRKLDQYTDYFADGSDLDPKKLKPLLVQVTDNWHRELFKIARLTWSLPYSFGFGRRLRYLILDEHNDKLMGLFALQSPPLSFPARDQLFNYPEGRKVELINQTMDIHTLGAVPPYSILLGGKLVALATTCNQVRDDYQARYKGRKTEIEKRVLSAHLVALTTTSAFGRSSIYNRLKYKGELVAQSIGFTKGYGNFHLQKLYPIFKEYLVSEGVSIQGGFGSGPRHSWQLICSTLNRIGFSGALLKHGIQREAFLFPLIANLKQYLEGEGPHQEFKYFERSFDDLAAYWSDTWMLPRSKRVSHWRTYQKSELLSPLLLPPKQANLHERTH